ncbi:transcription elongation factor GreA [Bacteroidota bacterium]|nr:transcription elongation factor GreA [Bacteroidota bacterium]MDC3115579.1 transcription elongation factor GreA [Bacteroidota bacterium]MDC3129848.1 transcription elongation factor GreA [Bacteroidota bacterium]MDC3153762.1 transcription elongation factor GreA [Bacteroidota bacterium]MDC3229819.1 transcription elongation factor GreA [Bacteroidota bacterium]
MSGFIYLSKEGMEKLKDELNYLKSTERPKIINQIAEARDKGDLSENAEYDAAKEAQGLLEARIARLENELSKSRVLDEKNIDLSTAKLLTTVEIENIQSKQKMSYTLVSESEADLKNKKISISSPIGSGLMGKKVGEIVDISVPSGIIKFKILDITI